MEIQVNRATEINRLYGEICDELRTTVQKAIRVGELLVEQKSHCAHGEWLPWLKANVRFSKSTAENFMNAYKRRGKFPTVGNLKELYGYLKDVVEVEAEVIATPEEEEKERRRQRLEEFKTLSQEEQLAMFRDLNKLLRENRTKEDNLFLFDAGAEMIKRETLEQGKCLGKIREAIIWQYGGRAWECTCWGFYGPPDDVNSVIEDSKNPELFEKDGAMLDKHGWMLDYHFFYRHQSKYFDAQSESERLSVEDFIKGLDQGYEQVSIAIADDYSQWLLKHEAELDAEIDSDSN